jgi:hexosaminidase
MTGLALVPRPATIRVSAEGFSLTADTVIAANGVTEPVAAFLAKTLRAGTGFPVPVRAEATGPAIRLALDAAIAGEEAYRLRIDASGAHLTARTPHGLFHATQTLLQLRPAHPGQGFPGVEIEDAPRFPWRDLMLDSSRHFWPVPFVRHVIDLMAMHKLNRFHWHLTDDQGWRIEIREYPRLTEIGAWRRRSQTNHKRDEPATFDEAPHGGFYTQAEIREIVAYAAERYITVVPEIDMPGHMQAAVAAYPHLGVGAAVAVSDNWLISPHVLHPRETTVAFMQHVLAEVLALFPGPYIHIGGDECDKTEWRASAEMQALIQAQGLDGEDGLQSWFIRRMSDFLTANGRTLVGWDEILEGGAPPGAIVMSWRGMQGGIDAARAGHDVVMTPQRLVYLDNYQFPDYATQPLASRFTTTLETVHAFDPVPPELTNDEARHVIGTGAKLWTEYVPTESHAEFLLVPRLCALAEVAWSPKAARDFGDFQARLTTHRPRIAQRRAVDL